MIALPIHIVKLLSFVLTTVFICYYIFHSSDFLSSLPTSGVLYALHFSLFTIISSISPATFTGESGFVQMG